jgi:hypothetical protein
MFSAATKPRPLVALPFQPVDIDGQAKAWDLREKGEEDGLSNLPEASATLPSAAEQHVALFINAQRTKLAGDLTSHLRAQNDAIAQLDTAMDIAGLRTDSAHAVSKIGQVHLEWKGEIPRLLRNAKEIKSQFDKFRHDHRISHVATTPQSRGLALSLMALLIVIESGFNAIFFAEGSDSGLIGGFGTALSISILNVVVFGFGLGFGPARWRHLTPAIQRIGGWLSLIVFSVAAILMNAFIAHYRDAYEKHGDAVDPTAVWHHLIQNPFHLTSMHSWLLFSFGLFFAFLGARKGYLLDDHYPGYGPISRRWDATERNYLQNRQQRLDEASRVRDDAKRLIALGIERLRGAAQQRQQILHQRARIIADFAAHETHLVEAATALLARYRDANRSKRTIPAPAYFNEPFSFEDEVLERPAIRALRTIEVPAYDADALIAELDRLRSDVLQAYDAISDDAPAVI